MKNETRKVSGKAYLVGGDEKATKALIDGILAMTPADRKAAVKGTLETMLIKAFEVDTEVQVPENLDEAAGMLANGMETITKQAIQKAVTNQYDKVRAEQVKDIVAKANIAEIIGKATTGK